MTELKPCPFCGCEDIDEYEGDFGNGVYCMNCGAMMGEPIHMEFRTNERVTYEQAAEAWNTRAERTCRNIDEDPSWFTCSNCEEVLIVDYLRDGCGVPSFCPPCGAKVVVRGD